MARHRLLLTISAASGLAVLGLPAHAEPDALSQPAPTSSHALARGVIAHQGVAVSGADVVAVAWPNQAKLAAIGLGQPVPTYVIGRTKTTPVGSFTIDVDPGSVPSDYRGKGDRVDVELVFGDATQEARWNYTVTPDASKGWVLTGTDARQPDLRADLGRSVGYDLGNDPATWVNASGNELGVAARRTRPLQVSAPSRDFNQLRSQSLPTLRAARMDTSAPAAKDSPAAPSDICTPMWGSYHYGNLEYFAKIYAWSGALATVYQQYGTDHTLGMGSVVSGGFSQAGTSTISLSASASRGGVADATAWNKVNYREYSSSCRPGYQLRPVGVHSLLVQWTYAPHQTWSTCTTYTGGTYTKGSGTNVTYSVGVNLGSGSVSSQTGWNTDTKYTWTVTKKTKLCGSTSAGWVSAPQAEAHAG